MTIPSKVQKLKCRFMAESYAQETFIRKSTITAGSSRRVQLAVRLKNNSLLNRVKRLYKHHPKFTIITANLVLFAVVGLVITYNSSDNSPSVNSSQSKVSALGEEPAPNPMDELSATDIAVHVARVTDLEEATAVKNKADTAKAELAVTSADDKVIAKPQIMAEGLKSKNDIQVYTVKKGDTVPKIAQKFDITSETVRLSNGIEGDTVDPGKKLLISPINGIVYTVKSGDTPQKLASTYRASLDQLIAFNDAELTRKFKVGERIVIPDGLSPISAEYNYVSSDNPGGFAFGNKPQYGSAGNNGYDYGWCTWHAANRRIEIGRPIPTNLGNAISWLGAAQAAGLETGSEPREGAVLYHLDIGGLGHVAFVEKVNSDGSFLVSDMNYPIWGQVTTRTVKAGDVGSYRFIY